MFSIKKGTCTARKSVVLCSIFVACISLIRCELSNSMADPIGKSFTVKTGSSSANAFITRWDTRNNGSTGNRQIQLPLVEGGSYNFTVHWGDGISNTITQWNDSRATHTYDNSGEYTVTITGEFLGWRFNDGRDFYETENNRDAEKLLDVVQWGTMKLGSFRSYFAGCVNLEGFSATDAPDLSETTNLDNSFANAKKFNTDLSNWDVSRVVAMERTFMGAESFNGDIRNWNVSNVRRMGLMFYEAKSFNQDISAWNVSKVKYMYGMLNHASSFDQDLSKWVMHSLRVPDDIRGMQRVFFNSGMEHQIYYHPTFPDFTTIWDTRKDGITNDRQIKLPLIENGEYDFIVDWGDEKLDTITHWSDPKATHTYRNPGEKTVKIKGVFSGWRFVNSDSDPYYQRIKHDGGKLIDVKRWGTMKLGQASAHFAEAVNLKGFSASDVPNLSETTSLAFIFYNANKFNTDLSDWAVSGITSMHASFWAAASFNGDISNWNISKTTNIENIFGKATAFNGDISDWNVSNVTTMAYAFAGAKSFNQNIGAWDVSKVTDMSYMFHEAHAFNADISGWNVSGVSNMKFMFSEAIAFNADISDWNVSSVEGMEYMFQRADAFNQDISTWDVSKVTNMYRMFYGAETFNQDLSGWVVNRVTTHNDFATNSGFATETSKHPPFQ